MSCAGSIGVGAPVSGSAPDCVFGKAITSRMFSSPARIAIEAVDAEREAGVRGRAEAERVEQEAEALLARVSASMPSSVKIALLDVGAVDPDAARAELPAVEHEVVRLRAHVEQRLARRRGEQLEVVGVRHRERVVRGDRAAVVVERLEQREVDDPEEAQRPFVDRGPPEVEADACRARGSTSAAVARGEQQEVAGSRAGRVDQAELLRLGEELHDRRLERAALARPASRPARPRRAAWPGR